MGAVEAVEAVDEAVKKNKQANKAVEAVEAVEAVDEAVDAVDEAVDETVELVTPLYNIWHGYKNAERENVSIKFQAGEQYPLTGELVQVFKQHPDYFKK